MIMSVLATIVHHAPALVEGVFTDPTADAPEALKTKVNTALGLVKWASIIAIGAVLLASGLMVWAGDRGYGGGLSPELKSKLMSAMIALVIVGSASQIVNFLA